MYGTCRHIDNQVAPVVRRAVVLVPSVDQINSRPRRQANTEGQPGERAY
jgi:hypothetical protein